MKKKQNETTARPAPLFNRAVDSAGSSRPSRSIYQVEYSLRMHADSQKKAGYSLEEDLQALASIYQQMDALIDAFPSTGKTAERLILAMEVARRAGEAVCTALVNDGQQRHSAIAAAISLLVGFAAHDAREWHGNERLDFA